jgi:hypothetical protein
VARKIYGSLGPAFYGLRTTLVTSVLLALLRIPRQETLKEHSPGDLGRIVGLDRVPEVKTLRRKLARLAAMKESRELGLEMARLNIAEGYCQMLWTAGMGSCRDLLDAVFKADALDDVHQQLALV